jgi:hypothetical protein
MVVNLPFVSLAIALAAASFSGGCKHGETVHHPTTSRSCSGSGWSSAGLVRDDPLGKVSIFNIATAVSDSGTAVVTWYETALPLGSSKSAQLYASACHAGSWTAPVPLGSTNTIQSILAARADGTAMAAWAEVAADGSTSIRVSTLDPATVAWGPPAQITPAGVQGLPSGIAMGNDGTAMIVWNQDDTVWAGRFDGSTWESPLTIGGGPSFSYVGITGRPDGQAYMALWEEDRPSKSTIWARRYSGGTWETATMLAQYDVSMGMGRPGAPRGSLAMDAAGNAAAGWVHQDRYIYGAMYRAATNQWTEGRQIADNSDQLILTLDAQGRAIATWSTNVQTDGGTATIEQAGWGDPQTGEWKVTDTLQSYDLRAVSDGKSHTWATWCTGSWETSDATLWAANYDPTGGFTAKRTLWTASGIENYYGLSLAVSPSGRALLAMITYGTSPVFHYSLVAFTYDPS